MLLSHQRLLRYKVEKPIDAASVQPEVADHGPHRGIVYTSCIRNFRETEFQDRKFIYEVHTPCLRYISEVEVVDGA